MIVDCWKIKAIEHSSILSATETVIMVVFNGCPTHIRFQNLQKVRIGVDGDSSQFELKLKQQMVNSCLLLEPAMNQKSMSINAIQSMNPFWTFGNVQVPRAENLRWRFGWFFQQRKCTDCDTNAPVSISARLRSYAQMQSNEPTHPHKDAINWEVIVDGERE